MTRYDDRSIAWTTDSTLHVTTLTARLRDALGAAADTSNISVGELWPDPDGFNLATLAHRFALDGDGSDLIARRGSSTYRIRVDPLMALDGAITGVVGHASPVNEDDDVRKIREQSLDALDCEVGSGWWYLDPISGETIVSPGLRALYGIDEIGAAEVRAFDHPDDRERIGREIALNDLTGTGFRCDHRIIRADGHIRTVREHVRAVAGREGSVSAWIGRVLDLTELRARELTLEKLAHYDALTRLPNRSLIRERIDAAMVLRSEDRADCAMFFVDLDEFKTVNDSYGHSTGDRILELVARRLERHVRMSDVVARNCGDEFLIFAEQIDGARGCDVLAHSLQSAFDAPFAFDGISIQVRASVGAVLAPPNRFTTDELIAAADSAMYSAKHAGGGKVHLNESDEQEEIPIVARQRFACIRSSPVRSRYASAVSG